MASISYSPAAFDETSASDLLRSSSSGVTGIPLKTLGKVRFVVKRRDVIVAAKMRKMKKHEYPWPADPHPNVKGGVLTHLSHFKPLKEKQKPVTLDFEKPLVDLEKKIVDVRKMANETGLDFSDQIISLENKYQQALKELYLHITPIQRVNIARHPNRPTFLDHVFNMTDKFVELHGDRAGYDDPAIVTGIGTIDGRRRYMFIGQQKGRNTKENIQRNFGMPTPHGYRKALRMMYYADHHGFPIVTFIDTPGAYADLKSEELGQGEAIAHNLRTMFGLKVPIVSIVIGEGGSGGALAVGCANKLLMLENAVFYVASPEACAAILWKSAKASPKAAEKLRITAPELCKLQICDGIIPEPPGGAHAGATWTSQQIKAAINETMDELTTIDTEELLKHRMHKFRKLGGFQEGVPIDPKKEVNMKKKEQTVPRSSKAELEGEIEKLKQQILKAKESSTKPLEVALKNMIEKLKEEAYHEYSEAIRAMGLKDRLEMLREEVSKVNSKDRLMNPVLMDKIEKLKHELNQSLSAAPNYTILKYKLDMLKEVSTAKSLSKAATMKQEVNKKFSEIMGRHEIKDKLEALEAEVQSSGVKDKILKLKSKIQLEMISALESLSLEVEVVKSNANPTSLSVFKNKVYNLNEEINKTTEEVVNSSELKNMMELLKLEKAKAEAEDVESESKIEALQQQIKQRISEAISSSELKGKHQELKAEISEAIQSSGGANGSLQKETKHAEPMLEMNFA
ncbi:hypothetical protein ES332_A13G105100v1 [Gossypium tomentosum]|nr:hypothetical protein ES332_A13G105100v1 [Gossypium tomentosum]